jgi:hypothetical protein
LFCLYGKRESKKHSVNLQAIYRTLPYSSYASKASDNLKELEYQEWSSAKQKHTITVYENFLSDFQDGVFSEQAEKRLIDLEVDAIFKDNHCTLPTMSQSSTDSNNFQHRKQILKHSKNG